MECKIIGPHLEVWCDQCSQHEYVINYLDGRKSEHSNIWKNENGKFVANIDLCKETKHRFDSLEEAKNWLNEYMIDLGYKIVSQEDFDKLKVLL